MLCVLHSSPWLPTFFRISAGVHPVSPLSWHVGKVAISNSRLFLLSPTDQPLPVITSNDSFLLQNLRTHFLLVLCQFSDISTNSHPRIIGLHALLAAIHNCFPFQPYFLIPGALLVLVSSLPRYKNHGVVILNALALIDYNKLVLR